jgi:hypothetical protein
MFKSMWKLYCYILLLMGLFGFWKGRGGRSCVLLGGSFLVRVGVGQGPGFGTLVTTVNLLFSEMCD